MASDNDPNQSFIDENEQWLMQRVDRARNGDSQALGELMAYYRDYLLNVANATMGNRLNGKVSASDLVQESLVNVNRNINGFRGDSPLEFKVWIRRIITNQVTDAQRKHLVSQRRNANREVRMNDSQLRVPPIHDRNPTPGAQSAFKEKVAMLETVLGSLPERYAKVITMRTWENHTFEEIGEVLELSADGARKLWYRAVVRLQKAIEQQCPGLNTASIFLEPDQNDESSK